MLSLYLYICYFSQHGWSEVYKGERWLNNDQSTNETGAGLGRGRKLRRGRGRFDLREPPPSPPKLFLAPVLLPNESCLKENGTLATHARETRVYSTETVKHKYSSYLQPPLPLRVVFVHNLLLFGADFFFPAQLCCLEKSDKTQWSSPGTLHTKALHCGW